MAIVTAKKIEASKPNAKKEKMLQVASTLSKILDGHPAFKSDKELYEKTLLNLKKAKTQILGITPSTSPKEVREVQKELNSLEAFIKKKAGNSHRLIPPLIEKEYLPQIPPRIVDKIKP